MVYRSTGGALEGLYGAFGNPTSVDRQRMYDEQSGALRGEIGLAQTDARRQAMGSATTATGAGNPFLAGRLGAQAGGEAAQRIGSQGVVQQRQLGAQQGAQELQARQQQGQWGQHLLGSLIGAGGQVLGMAVPASGALRGAAGAMGGGGLAGLLGGRGTPLGSMVGSALGAPQQAPQAPTPQVGIGQGGFSGSAMGPSSPGLGLGMQWDSINNRWVPVDPR